MTVTQQEQRPAEDGPPDDPPATSPFILYLRDDEYTEELTLLSNWVRLLLVPVYAREVSSATPWCGQWWRHPEAVAQLHGLWLAWQELTGPDAGLCGPANWHRDYLEPVLNSLRNPAGPFAGCKVGAHRAKEVPHTEPY